MEPCGAPLVGLANVKLACWGEIPVLPASVSKSRYPSVFNATPRKAVVVVYSVAEVAAEAALASATAAPRRTGSKNGRRRRMAALPARQRLTRDDSHRRVRSCGSLHPGV